MKHIAEQAAKMVEEAHKAKAAKPAKKLPQDIENENPQEEAAESPSMEAQEGEPGGQEIRNVKSKDRRLAAKIHPAQPSKK